DVQTVTYGSYTGYTSGSSITASATPKLTSAVKYKDTTLTGWTTSFPGDSMVCFAMSSPSTLGAVHASINITGSN
ncbi:MAG: hypothetical protein WAN65_28690, partial [Candidatus Sulfotelmatobacter sp.]